MTTRDYDTESDEPATDPTCVGTHNAECNGSTSPRSGGDGRRCQDCREERQRKWAERIHEALSGAAALEVLAQGRLGDGAKSKGDKKFHANNVAALTQAKKFVAYWLDLVGEVDLDDLGIDAPEWWKP